MKSSLLQSLFDDIENRPLTISELNAEVRGELERRFSSVWLEGEISDFAEANSGHWYFTLRDNFSQLKAACFRGSNYRIRFKPFDGLQVRVRGNLSVYEPRGEYQIIVETLDPIGEGALKVAFEQLKLKLAKEGLFDSELKRKIPLFPRKIGVVTSPNGAAIHDILNVLSRRAKSVSIVLIPTRVQGENAGEEISQAIETANEFNRKNHDKIDVLIVGRGGGSSEDLWAFNDEKLARTIRGSRIPIISAVGHETDFTIADFVADLRAATPSAAAEIVALREDQIEEFLARKLQDLNGLMNYKILTWRSAWQELAHSSVFVEFPQKLKDFRFYVEDLEQDLANTLTQKIKTENKRLEELRNRLSPLKLSGEVAEGQKRLAVLIERQKNGIKNVFQEKEENLKVKMTALDALSPLSVLKRGFSVTQNEEGKILTEIEQIEVGQSVQIRLSNGKLKAKVLDKGS